MLDFNYLEQLETYIASGQLAEDFTWSPEERRHEILEFLERIMDVAELADKTATTLIFKNSQLGALLVDSTQK